MEDALIREIKEELNMEILIKNIFYTVEHDYPDFRITMHSFICSCGSNKINLTEHIDFKWLEKDELTKLDWAAADLPIVHKLAQL